MHNAERQPVAGVGLFELVNQTRRPLRKFLADVTHFGRRSGVLRAGKNNGLQLQQRVIDFVVAKLRDLRRGIARGRKEAFPDSIAYPIAIRAIERVDVSAPGLYASTATTTSDEA